MASYRIKFETDTDLLAALGEMLGAGFVFTIYRYRTMAKILSYLDCHSWRYIYVGHDVYSVSEANKCKMVMNTACRPDNWNTDFEVTYQEFVKTILPSW
jgi:hypothetical protein